METHLTLTDSFSAAHRTHDGEPSREHGHNYRVRITTSDVRDYALGEDLDQVLVELHLRPLEEMLTGGLTTPPGIAAWICEQLLQRHPYITAVEVEESDRLSGGITREPRVLR